MAEEKEPVQVTGISEQELREIVEGPAVYVNKVYVTAQGAVARLTFAEAGPQGVHFRSAVLMTIGDLISLRDVISSVIAEGQAVQVRVKRPDA